MKHFFYVLLLSIGFVSNVTAQNENVSQADSLVIRGLVVSSPDTIPLEGVTVKVPNTDQSATTDAKGRYVLNLTAPADTLIFTLKGYVGVKAVARGRKAVNIMLKKDDTPPPLPPSDTDTTALPKGDSTLASTDTTKTPTDSTALAQQDSTAAQGGPRVTGTVIGADSVAIPGASVMIKGTTIGVVTDTNGKYKINLSSPNDVLIYSFVGLANKEVPVNGQTSINVTLKEEEKVLQEVV
jgi:hypothetical protein